MSLWRHWFTKAVVARWATRKANTNTETKSARGTNETATTTKTKTRICSHPKDGRNRYRIHCEPRQHHVVNLSFWNRQVHGNQQQQSRTLRTGRPKTQLAKDSQIQPLPVVARPPGVHRSLFPGTQSLCGCRSLRGRTEPVRSHHQWILLPCPGCCERKYKRLESQQCWAFQSKTQPEALQISVRNATRGSLFKNTRKQCIFFRQRAHDSPVRFYLRR